MLVRLGMRNSAKALVAITIAVALAIILVPTESTDASRDVEFSVTGNGATVEQITSADQLPASLQESFVSGSIGVAFTLPGTNPYEEGDETLVDFRITYDSDRTETATVNAAAVDADGNVRLEYNGDYTIDIGDSTVYASDDNTMLYIAIVIVVIVIIALAAVLLTRRK